MTVSKKQISVFDAPLNPGDSLEKTIGCRHAYPFRCGKNSVPNKCAFVREDGICQVPPWTWKSRFESLKEKQ